MCTRNIIFVIIQKYTACACNCVVQDLVEELGSFAHVATLQANSENLISVIQEAYNVRADLYDHYTLHNIHCTHNMNKNIVHVQYYTYNTVAVC